MSYRQRNTGITSHPLSGFRTWTLIPPLLLVWAGEAQATTSDLLWPEQLPNEVSSTLSGISADGSTLVGWGTVETGKDADGSARRTQWAYRWGASSMVRQIIDNPYGDAFKALGVSGDGSIVVGQVWSSIANPWPDTGQATSRAFRWSAAEGLQLLPLAGDGKRDGSIAYAISRDGSTIVGNSGIYSTEIKDGVHGTFVAVRWRGLNKPDVLGVLPGGRFSTAFGVSASGDVVAGNSENDEGRWEAFRWTEALGMKGLGALEGATVRLSNASAVSVDGTLVIGLAANASNRLEAFRWTLSDPTTGAGTMKGLGVLPGKLQSSAKAMTADGSVIVGYSGNAGWANSEAFRYTDLGGMQSVTQWLAHNGYGLNRNAGDRLITATGVSADGNSLVGSGVINGRSQGYLARVVPKEPEPGPKPDPEPDPKPDPGPETGKPGTGVLGLDDFAESLTDVSYATALSLSHLSRFLDMGLGCDSISDQRWCLRASTNTQHYAEAGLRGRQAGAQLVLAYHLSDTLSAGLGYARDGWGDVRHQAGYDELQLRARQSNIGAYLEFGAETGLQLRGALAYAKGNPELRRDYAKGTQAGRSSGNAGLSAWGANASAGYAWAYSEQLTLTPSLGLSWTQSRIEAYREHGGMGAFPAQFAARSERQLRGSLGSEARWRLAPDVTLTAATTYQQVLKQQADRLNGRVLGLFDFSLPVATPDNGWWTVQAGVQHRLSAYTAVQLDLGRQIDAGRHTEPQYFGSAGLTFSF